MVAPCSWWWACWVGWRFAATGVRAYIGDVTQAKPGGAAFGGMGVKAYESSQKECAISHNVRPADGRTGARVPTRLCTQLRLTVPKVRCVIETRAALIYVALVAGCVWLCCA